ncbi:MAG TPA: hypothetical protein VLQ79_03535 [Myxococcaceae bacterium]|nr:hypothetical protein [Myxococcaceae bacterium]
MGLIVGAAVAECEPMLSLPLLDEVPGVSLPWAVDGSVPMEPLDRVLGLPVVPVLPVLDDCANAAALANIATSASL